MAVVESREIAFSDENYSLKGVYGSREGLCGLVAALEAHINRIPVVGFNSQNYDINVMKGALIRHLRRQLDEEEDFGFVVEKVDKIACIETKRFRFLDACNFIAPGFSYDKLVSKGF